MANVLIEGNSGNTPEYYYVYGAGGLLYRIKAVDNTVQYYHYDSRGSTIAITNQSQVITHKYKYDEFGSVLACQEADFNPFRYVGQYGVMYDDSLLYYMRARYYRPDIGQFLSEDPVWGVNLYQYADNNPIIKTDYEGRSATLIVAGAAVGATIELTAYIADNQGDITAKGVGYALGKGAINGALSTISPLYGAISSGAFAFADTYAKEKSLKKAAISGLASGLISYMPARYFKVAKPLGYHGNSFAGKVSQKFIVSTQKKIISIGVNQFLHYNY
jgi:RHS repeat-associated protein